jgi:ADP-ribose pyrophosphatase YjhB (NUDIX family)
VGRFRDPALRALYRVGFVVLRVYWFLVRPTKQGVKCVITRPGAVLLVRHTYGPRGKWELPGGGVKRGEPPEHAARREMQEELGLDIAEWAALGDVLDRIDRKRDTLHCFTAELGDRALDPDPAEIAEVGWFEPDRLPQSAGKHIPRILARRVRVT